MMEALCFRLSLIMDPRADFYVAVRFIVFVVGRDRDWNLVLNGPVVIDSGFVHGRPRHLLE